MVLLVGHDFVVPPTHAYPPPRPFKLLATRLSSPACTSMQCYLPTLAKIAFCFQWFARCSLRNPSIFNYLHCCPGGVCPPLRSYASQSSCNSIPLPLFPLFSYSCALFCTRAKHNSFVFMHFHTLCEKHPGWG